MVDQPINLPDSGPLITADETDWHYGTTAVVKHAWQIRDSSLFEDPSGIVHELVQLCLDFEDVSNVLVGKWPAVELGLPSRATRGVATHGRLRIQLECLNNNVARHLYKGNTS